MISRKRPHPHYRLYPRPGEHDHGMARGQTDRRAEGREMTAYILNLFYLAFSLHAIHNGANVKNADIFYEMDTKKFFFSIKKARLGWLGKEGVT